MSKLYFGICPYGSLCDVFINTLAGWSDEWIQPCTPNIRKDGQPIHEKHERYVISLSGGKPMTFRDIDWPNRLDDLEYLVTEQEKKVWVGSFHPHHAKKVKRYFGDMCTTVGISFEPITRHKVIDNLIACNPDKDYEPLVPAHFRPTNVDVTVPLESFYIPNEYIKHVEDIDGFRNMKQLDYYYTWLYRTQGRKK
jgi:hypothetical protein